MATNIEIEVGNESENDKAEEMKDKAEEGRGGDVVMGHLTPGEIVLPLELALKLEKMLTEEFKKAKMDINEYIVGHPKNKINPETECPEFFSWSSLNPVNIVKNAWNSVTDLVGSGIMDVLESLGLAKRPPEYKGPSAEEIAAQEAETQRLRDEENRAKADQAAAEEESRKTQAEIARIQQESEKDKADAEVKSKKMKEESDVIQRESSERRLSRMRARKRSTNRPMLSSGVSLSKGE